MADDRKQQSKQPGPLPPPYDPDAPNSSGTRRSLFPPLWQRFKQQIEDPTALPESTGAHVTLEDLEKLAELREASNPVYLPRPGPAFKPGDKISGWVGTPDPSKFIEGTNTLTPDEVQQEVAKGNIVMLDDWVKEISNLELWEKKMLYDAMLTDWMQNRFFVKTENGAKVSFWDLYNYVYHNPELKALVDSRHTDIKVAGEDDASTSEDLSGQRVAPGLYGDPGPGMWQELDLETARQMPWGLVCTGKIWRRRPTRWLWGMDGLMDCNFGMYVHEAEAHKILGPKYANQDPRHVVMDEQYEQDIMRAGPMMGMTFMITAARELPAQEACDALTSRLVQRLHQRALRQAPQRQLPPANSEASSSSSGSGQITDSATFRAINEITGRFDGAMHALYDVYCMVGPENLAPSTQLLDPSGTNIRPGSMLILNTAPEGKITLQAMTPGLAREREAYVLGAVNDMELAEAVVEEFLGEDPVDPEFAANVPISMLMFVNGFQTDNTNCHPHMRHVSEGPGFEVELIPAKATVFSLPRVGARQETGEVPPSLLSGVQERVMVGALAGVYQRAYDAAMNLTVEASPEAGGDGAQEGGKVGEQEVAARKEEARAVLEQGLAGLGLNVQGLTLDDMFGDAEPFDEELLASIMAEERSTASAQHDLRRAKLCLSGKA